MASAGFLFTVFRISAALRKEVTAKKLEGTRNWKVVASSEGRKTGSAEFDENGSSHSWFIGYSNVDDPDLVVAIIVENGGTGSEAAVPIAEQIFDAYYYDKQ